MTAGYHVPRNNMLESLDPNSAEGIAYLGNLPRRVDSASAC